MCVLNVIFEPIGQLLRESPRLHLLPIKIGRDAKASMLVAKRAKLNANCLGQVQVRFKGERKTLEFDPFQQIYLIDLKSPRNSRELRSSGRANAAEIGRRLGILEIYGSSWGCFLCQNWDA